MLSLISVVLLTLAVCGVLCEERDVTVENKDCPTREECMDCVLKYADIDGDALIGIEEIRAAKAKYLTWFERFMAWGTGQSAELMLELCDADNDGYISHEDFVKSEKTCLAECFKRQLFFDKICRPAEAAELLAKVNGAQ